MAAILSAAVAGLFGDGTLSRATLQVGDLASGVGLLADYERFGRAHSEYRFVFSGAAGAENGRSFSLWMSDGYLNGRRRSRNHTGTSAPHYFQLAERPWTVIFRFQPQRSGCLAGGSRMNDRPATRFEQWLWLDATMAQMTNCDFVLLLIISERRKMP